TPGKIIELLGAWDPAKLDVRRMAAAVHFLRRCEDPAKWPALEKYARHLLTQPGLDAPYRSELHMQLMDALAHQGKADAAIALAPAAIKEVEHLESLAVAIKLKVADIYSEHLNDVTEAGKRYQAIIDEHRRLAAPVVREAAVHYGDALARSGDFV